MELRYCSSGLRTEIAEALNSAANQYQSGLKSTAIEEFAGKLTAHPVSSTVESLRD